MTALGMLWQPLCEGQALGLHQEAEEAEEAEEEEAEEVEEAEGNQLLSLHSNLSLSQQPQTSKSWGRSPKSSTEKETRLTPL